MTRRKFLIVTGLSGAGRSTVLRALEDLDFEAVDNLPLPILQRLMSSDEALERDFAVGLDTRTRGFDPAAIVDLVDKASSSASFACDLVFCDCEDSVIQRRYSETRRPHPMAPDRRVPDGIAIERRLLAPLKERAGFVLDTSETSPRALAERVAALVGERPGKPFAITVMSFAFRHGLPVDADLVFDVRFLRNPHYRDELKYRTGMEKDVADYIRADPDFALFGDHLRQLLMPLLPRYQKEGKSYLTIAFGCTGGQHRSVFLAEWLSSRLSLDGWAAKTFHREVESRRISTKPII